jgi:two-component sensor histidine kinase
LKYGALTVASGHVSIRWSTEHQEGKPKFVFVWREFGGPLASEPTNTGFGSRLISRVLQDDFGGSVEVSYEATGLVCLLTAPLENLATSSE